ncbi:MAG: lipopolysaccharide biosynthesis protein, partial [Kordiimonas sp.]
MDNKTNKARVAGGAGYALAGRFGAIIEAASFIAFTWLYGAATFGLYAVLWSYVKVSSAVCEMAMTTALQRYIPKASKENESNIVGYAIKLSLLISLVAALVLVFAAPYLTQFINASEADTEHLVTVVRIYAWVLPLWCFVNVTTAAVRATRNFGPEVKVRIFYEQGLRLITASMLATLGFLTYGLFIAHLLSIFLSAILAAKLAARYFDLKSIISAPITGSTAREILQYGRLVMPAYLVKMLFSEFPVIFLNMLLPGSAGAAAGGFYSVARKIASALQAVHKTFEYVMAPLAAEKDGSGDHAALADMFAYATRLSITLILPFAAALLLARHDILSVMRPEFQAASTAIAILCVGRVLEAASGPSAVIIEMLGHRALPAFNGIMGFMVLVGIGSILIPKLGVTGAAIAAA